MINQHHSKILNETRAQQKKSCRCRQKESCPLKSNLQVQNIVYKAKPENHRICYGISEGKLTLRFNNHSSFKNRKNSNKAELPKHIWQLNEDHIAINLE